MKHFVLKFITTSLFFIATQSSVLSSDDKNFLKVHTVEVSQIQMTILHGDGFFSLTRRLFQVLEKNPNNITWEDVFLLKTIYQEQTGSDELVVGEKFIVLKNEFL
ncbi:hypothetical protein KMW28_25860 [Flammeovirga yaeyamensis]|uniref:Uncharacterized protein n=1 Tax=Flammeovirga yaeyamensis TaxID=367791 RepID=A0AAX1NDY7_9BACT|nr:MULTISPECIES: hypothetical protein [Flammeovirga]ANQ52058.1 hypothetical protein MY04_4723 [Flammeovirga sp. MY04]MBB3699274.1 hypothetical protein [Flammeovirga yaeyamensis]NMF35463.1 hypothetical protein [Flammeovirga yaeyamensis]QWG04323.1 hypothetical protein KMW28_25860 [Flammeovirga yaeyamensis]